MAMRIVVTTWPCPRLLSTPKTDIGATGWMTMTPYRIKSQSVRERLRRVGETAVLPGSMIPAIETFYYSAVNLIEARELLPWIGKMSDLYFGKPSEFQEGALVDTEHSRNRAKSS